MPPPVFVASPDAADVAAVRAVNPLSAELTMRCGGFEVPVGLVASTATLEDEDSEAARAVREFIDEDPWAGMGSVHPGGWILLARDRNTIVAGQRHGRVGLGHIVVLDREGGRFTARTLGGWSLGTPDRERAHPVFRATTGGTSLRVEWTCGQNMACVPNEVLSRCEVLETDTTVHLLLWARPNPDLPPPGAGMVVGTAATAFAPITLREPLGARDLYDDARIPARTVDVTAAGDQ